MYKSAQLTPVENTLVQWKTSDSPLIPMAKIILDRQHFDYADRDTECTTLRFTPGHYHPFHRPTGNMGRGRVFTYNESQNLRGANDHEPNASLVQEWRSLGHVSKP
jgi:hypothetical protein